MGPGIRPAPPREFNDTIRVGDMVRMKLSHFNDMWVKETFKPGTVYEVKQVKDGLVWVGSNTQGFFAHRFELASSRYPEYKPEDAAIAGDFIMTGKIK
jgi:hypothetical protein